MNANLSVVIPSHNRPDLLEHCLRSVLPAAPPGTEVLVVDDGSTNGTVGAVAARHQGVQLLRLRRCRGFCAAANAGIRAAQGTIVELLNDDTEVTPGWAEAALACFADPEVAAVAPLVLQWPGASGQPVRIDSAGDRYYLGGVAAKRGHGESLGSKMLPRCRVFGASAAAAFYRRDPLLQVGAFPESFGAYFEDVDLAFRLHRAGYQILFEPASRVLHHVAASHGRSGRVLLEQQSRNEERVFWRNLPTPTLLRALPRHVAVLAGKVWRRWGQGQLIPFLCGRLRVLGEVPDILRHRQRLPPLRNEWKLQSWLVENRYWG